MLELINEKNIIGDGNNNKVICDYQIMWVIHH